MSLKPFTRKTRSQVNKSLLSKVSTKENIYKPGLSRAKICNNKDNVLQCLEKGKLGMKRKADSEALVDNKLTRKRAAFGDITNALQKNFVKGKSEALKPLNSNGHVLLYQSSLKTDSSGKSTKENATTDLSNGSGKSADQLDTLDESIIILSQKLKIDSNKKSLEDFSSYITASEGSPVVEKDDSASPTQDLKTTDSPRPPPDVEDFDRASSNDIHAVSSYAMAIFNYYKEREVKFPVSKYISNQPDVTRTMRSILVDWMVEVQESFELNHETLYLAVKFVDLYLSKVVIKRERLQLVGSTALFVACKFDERTLPYADDFLYICDDAYKRKELISMEISMLKTLDYDLGIPISYRYLRRYARCAKVSMETLTFSRYILEMSLMEYDLIDVSPSLLAAAALFLALNVKEELTQWSPTLTYYSGYNLSDFGHLVHSLHHMILQPPKEHLRTIRNKYSHKVFFEVAKIHIPAHLNI